MTNGATPYTIGFWRPGQILINPFQEGPPQIPNQITMYGPEGENYCCCSSCCGEVRAPPRQVQVGFAGIETGDPTCVNCSILNRSYVLDSDYETEGECRWFINVSEAVGPDPPCSNDFLIEAYMRGTVTEIQYEVQIISGAFFGFFGLTAPGADCYDPQVLTLANSGSGNCLVDPGATASWTALP